MNKISQVQIGPAFGSPIGQTVGIADLISVFLSNAVVIAAVIFTLLLIFGGISMIMGAGESDPQKTAQGKKAATAAVAGFVIIFVSYWIIKIIEIIAGFSILRPAP